MSAKAGQTAEPNGVNIFEKTLEHQGGGLMKKIFEILFFQNFLF